MTFEQVYHLKRPQKPGIPADPPQRPYKSIYLARGSRVDGDFITLSWSLPVIGSGTVGVVTIVGVREIVDATGSQIGADVFVDNAFECAHGIEWVVDHVVAVQVGCHVQELVEEVGAGSHCRKRRSFAKDCPSTECSALA